MSKVVSLDALRGQKVDEVLATYAETLKNFVEGVSAMALDPEECCPMGLEIVAAAWQYFGEDGTNVCYLDTCAPYMVEKENGDDILFNHAYLHGTKTADRLPTISSVLLEAGEFKPEHLPQQKGRQLLLAAFNRYPLTKVAIPRDPIFVILYMAEERFGFTFQSLSTHSEWMRVVLVSPTERITLTIYPKYYHELYLKLRAIRERDERIKPDKEFIDWSVFEPK